MRESNKNFRVGLQLYSNKLPALSLLFHTDSEVPCLRMGGILSARVRGWFFNFATCPSFQGDPASSHRPATRPLKDVTPEEAMDYVLGPGTRALKNTECKLGCGKIGGPNKRSTTDRAGTSGVSWAEAMGNRAGPD